MLNKTNPLVKSFYHQETCTWTHAVSCPIKKTAAIIDPVLDYNANNGNTSTQFVDKVLAYLENKKMQLKYVLETHAHADHITAAAYIADKIEIKVAIGEQIQSVQKTFKSIFNFDDAFKTDGSQFHALLNHGDELKLGECMISILYTPGHTNDSITFIAGESVFVGDTLFSPGYGTARCDFPGGDAKKLYQSVQKIYALGNNKKLYLCHDYPPQTRIPQAWFYSSQQQKENIHINANTLEKDFVQMREKRDETLNQPKLIIPAIQVNIAAGNFPKPESNGKTYLKIPVDVLGKKENHTL